MNLTFSGDTGILASVQEGIQILLKIFRQSMFI